MIAKEILKELIRFDTYKDKENKKIMDYIQKLLIEKGFKIDYRSKCLVASIKEKCKLGFIGHTDTVQSGDDWIFNPLKLTEEDNKLYGLGTCDMKGGIAAILQAVLDIDWNKMNYGIKLFFTYDEEIGFGGIREINELKLDMPDNIIIGEPSNNVIMNGSKGLMEYKIEFNGKSAHSSNPKNGINAIEKCIKFINELEKFYQNLKKDIDNRFEIPYTTMNIGKIYGGKSINIVANNCSVEVDFRVINNDNRIKILNEINRLKDKLQCEYQVLNDIKPFISDCKNIKTTNFITEASFIKSKNRYILGVGPMNMHEANEYITIDSLEKLVIQYKKMIKKICT